jgi:hypothetical protein
MKNLIFLVSGVVLFVAIHEGLHALVATTFSEYDAFYVRPYGFEVVFKTPVADRQGIQWAAISGVPNVVTVLLGYLLLVLRYPLASHKYLFVRSLAYWLTLLLLVADPLNLALGPFIYGGDALGIAVGLEINVLVVQILAFGLLVINRELVAQILLPSFGVISTHPLFKPLIRVRGLSHIH